MPVQIAQPLRRGALLEVEPVRVERDAHLPDLPGDQRTLFRPDHPHGDVRIAAQQVFIAIRQREFHQDPRLPPVDASQDRREDFGPEDLARRDSHRPLLLVAVAGGRALRCLG